MSDRLSIDLPPEFIEAVAQRVVELDVDRRHEPDGYLDVAGAAEFLACPKSRIYALASTDRIPTHRDGSRLLFDRAELREWVRRGGAKRP